MKFTWLDQNQVFSTPQAKISLWHLYIYLSVCVWVRAQTFASLYLLDMQQPIYVAGNVCCCQ